ncbi:glycosyltransferase [Pseudomethylobacillus aquaticus]|uniref:Glycosyltransferase n=1 Tax=Pseudomethylobacillus aquaticus TaxID=2676064 RepID=A0A3N0UY60_9PROT|nr:glycosyltransferase family 2 protein [Pseudomethylobacillus aquaticus]ROH85496.1 glycosyltransferase [Pseudomethylobacillus aquaticus]
MPLITVIIVNYKTSAHVMECIPSLLAQQGVELQIIVLDNDSQDAGLDNISSTFGERVTVIKNTQNYGFGRANNIGASLAVGQYILCINPDIKIDASDVLSKMAGYLDGDQGIGVAGPAVLEPRKNRVIKPKLRYPQQHRTKYSQHLDGLPGQYAWILGAFMLFPKHVYQAIAGFDEDYFLYGEDADICLRVRQAGYTVAHYADVSVSHWSGASEAGASDYEKWKRKKTGYFTFFTKHYDARDVKRIAAYRRFVCRYTLLCRRFTSIFIKQHQNTHADAKVRAELDVIKSMDLIT